jgi:hypothetical protein
MSAFLTVQIDTSIHFLAGLRWEIGDIGISNELSVAEKYGVFLRRLNASGLLKPPWPGLGALVKVHQIYNNAPPAGAGGLTEEFTGI